MRNRVMIVVLAILVALISLMVLVPRVPRISPIQAFVAAFPEDLLTLVMDFPSRTWILPRRVSGISEVDLGPQVSVVSFSVDRKLGSGSLQVLFHPNAAWASNVDEIQLRCGSTWFPRELGQIELDVRPEDTDTSMTLIDEAVLMHGTDDSTYQISFANTTSDTVFITAVSAPGLACITNCPVAIEAGGIAVLDVTVDQQTDWVRPWVYYQTSSGDHVMPGPSLHRRPN